MQVDHVIPESLKDDPAKLATVLTNLGRPPDFDLNSYANWMPTCGPCNNRKRDAVFVQSGFCQVVLQQAANRAAEAQRAAEQLVSDRKIASAVNLLVRGSQSEGLQENTVKSLRLLLNSQSMDRGSVISFNSEEIAGFLSGYSDASDPELIHLVGQALTKALLASPTSPAGAEAGITDPRRGDYETAYLENYAGALKQRGRGAYSSAVDCLTAAISAARPIRRGDLISTAFEEVAGICVAHSHKVPLVPRWLFLERVALVLYDFCDWKGAATVAEGALQLREKIGPGERSSSQPAGDAISSFRRQAVIQACTGRLSRPALKSTMARLRDDASEFMRRRDFDGYATQFDVAGKIAFEVLGDAQLSHSCSEEVLARDEDIKHKWVLQEIYWREAEFYRAQRPDHDKKREMAMKAIRIAHDHPVILEPKLGAHGPEEHDPLAEITRYGIQAGELRERGILPTGRLPRAVSLRLDGTEVHRIVRSVMQDIL